AAKHDEPLAPDIVSETHAVALGWSIPRREAVERVRVRVVGEERVLAASRALPAKRPDELVEGVVRGPAVESSDDLPRVLLGSPVRRRPHVGPGIARRVVKPDGRVLEPHAAAPLVSVPEGATGETDEATVGGIVDVRAVHAAGAGGRARREALLPVARVEVEGERVEALRDAVVPSVVDPLALMHV